MKRYGKYPPEATTPKPPDISTEDTATSTAEDDDVARDLSQDAQAVGATGEQGLRNGAKSLQGEREAVVVGGSGTEGNGRLDDGGDAQQPLSVNLKTSFDSRSTGRGYDELVATVEVIVDSCTDGVM